MRGDVAVGTCVSSHAPRPDPYVRLSRIRLVWGFRCQGHITPSLARACCFILLFDPRREHSSVPTAYYHRRRAQRGSRTALLQRRRRLVLDHREHGGRLPAIGWSAAQRSEGSLPLAASDRRANHACIRLNPHRVSTMKQSYASAGKAPKRRVHSPIGIVAIAVCGLPPPRIVIGLPGASNAVRCRTCLSFLALECCSRRRAQLDTVRHLTGRDQAPQRYQQFARQCHDHCRLARATRTLGPRAIPPRQRTVFLEHQEAPRQLNQPTSYPRIAGLGQALLSAFQPALIGRSREPGVTRQRSSISKIPRQDLPHQQVRRLDTDTDYPGEQPHHRMRPCIRCLLEPLGTCLLDRADLLTDQCQPCHVAPELLDHVCRQTRALRCSQTCQTLRSLTQMCLESPDPETGKCTLHAVDDA